MLLRWQWRHSDGRPWLRGGPAPPAEEGEGEGRLHFRGEKVWATLTVKGEW
jgi:hypothetical protein